MYMLRDVEEVKQTRSKSPSSTKSHKNDSTPGTFKKCTRCSKKQNIHATSALNDMQNGLSAIRKGTTVACVSRRGLVSTSITNVETTEPNEFSKTGSERKVSENSFWFLETQWVTLLKVNNVEVKFKIDTGTEVQQY